MCFLEAHTHVFLDLTVTSGADALEELERILKNMPTVLELMIAVRREHTILTYYNSQYRDGKY